ncbi:hypothetical protein VNO77_43529 [Canavalia gladiata]|uniref:Uncharacterized protein n=1 Tax=Canavalia gladiata TaxID=3824 RepID=A0AAN9JWL0_CANGL
MDQKLKLETPSEQSRLLSNIPTVIPEIIDTNLPMEGSPIEDKLEQNDLSEMAIGEPCNSVERHSKLSGLSHSLDNRTDVAGPKTQVKRRQDGAAFPASVEQLLVYTTSQDKRTSQRKLSQSSSKAKQDDPKTFKELNSDSQNSNPANYCLRQPRNTKSGADIGGRNLRATRNARWMIKEKQTISVANPVKVSVSNKQDTSISAIPVEVVESPEISIWHCVGPYGEKRGPYSMSALKHLSETASCPLELKVWKTGQSETEAIPLSDALKRISQVHR